MKPHAVILTIIITALVCGAARQDPAKAPPALPATTSPNVVVIPVSGPIDPAMTAFIGRSLKESRRYTDKIIVLELDTYGGEVDAAFRIVDTMLTVGDCQTIAYVKTKAISAGALIALSCRRLVMQHNTTIGDVAPLMMSDDGPKMLGEKFQSPIRAKFRTLAKRNGYPERLTEAMVTTGLIVYQVKFSDTTLYLDSTEFADLGAAKKKTALSTRAVVKRGELLTLDDIEAKNLSFSRMSVASIEEMLSKMGYASPAIIRIKRNWSEDLVKYIGIIAPFLMIIGLGALYLEFKTPGFGGFGAIGAICLGLVFFGQYMVGLADYTELLLAALGLGLIAVELFLFPTMGLLLVSGVALLFVALVLSLQGFVIPKPEFPWQQQTLLVSMAKVLGSGLLAGVLALVVARFLLPGLAAVVKGPYLAETLGDAHVELSPGTTIAANDNGVVITALRPAGKASIDGEVYDVVADGEFIEKGTPITVQQVQGTRIVVIRRVEV